MFVAIKYLLIDGVIATVVQKEAALDKQTERFVMETLKIKTPVM